MSGIAVGSVLPWSFQMRHFRWFSPAALPNVVHSSIGLLSDSYTYFLHVGLLSLWPGST